MLLSFRCDNFKSFANGFSLSMKPVNRLRGLEYSVIAQQIAGKKEKSLSASVIYGPNAAGKTSVINALSCFKQIVARGHVLDSENEKVGDRVSDSMALIPFRFRGEAKPVAFDIEFTHESSKYRYQLSFSVGLFMDEETPRAIEYEGLYVNESLVFERTANDVPVLTTNPIAERCNVGYSPSDDERTRKMMSDNLTAENLLLVTDFNSFCSKQVVASVKSWFSEKLIVVNDGYRARFTPVSGFEDGQALVESNLNRIAKEAGLFGTEFAYYKNPESKRTELVTVLKRNGEAFEGINSEQIESFGTLRLVSIMPAVLVALSRGAVLAADELDASIHPTIMMNIISLFHNDEVNVNGAQVVFDTHNPIFLNNKLLRRDEIKFVERDRDTKSSRLYALSDFRANGEVSVRRTSDYMKNYFINRYGAIEDIDFTDVVIGAMKSTASEEL